MRKRQNPKSRTTKQETTTTTRRRRTIQWTMRLVPNAFLPPWSILLWHTTRPLSWPSSSPPTNAPSPALQSVHRVVSVSELEPVHCNGGAIHEARSVLRRAKNRFARVEPFPTLCDATIKTGLAIHSFTEEHSAVSSNIRQLLHIWCCWDGHFSLVGKGKRLTH